MYALRCGSAVGTEATPRHLTLETLLTRGTTQLNLPM